MCAILVDIEDDYDYDKLRSTVYQDFFRPVIISIEQVTDKFAVILTPEGTGNQMDNILRKLGRTFRGARLLAEDR